MIVVLVCSNDLSEVVIFETNTIRYDPELYYWGWNKKNNLFGYSKQHKKHKFVWQSGGTQFTIIEDVPDNRMIINVKKPELINKEIVLNKIGFDKSWITVTHKNG